MGRFDLVLTAADIVEIDEIRRNAQLGDLDAACQRLIENPPAKLLRDLGVTGCAVGPDETIEEAQARADVTSETLKAAVEQLRMGDLEIGDLRHCKKVQAAAIRKLRRELRRTKLVAIAFACFALALGFAVRGWL